MTAINFGGGTVIRIDGAGTRIAAVTGAVGGCGGGGGTSVAGVSAIEVGGSQMTGVVEFAGSGNASVTSQGNVVTISASAATTLRGLTDVAIATDANGNPIIADGSVLKFTEYETGGVWTASTTLDGGSYV
jgi:hypothetical protein